VFTGIVRERGRVVRADGGLGGLALELEAPETAALSRVGDSVSIGGACLTVTSVQDGRLTFHAVPETLERSSLGRLEPGADVNLEPALRAGDPLGGHYVQGHVDGVGRVRSLEAEGEGARLWVAIALVPHTLEVTTLGRVAAGDPVNLEADVIAKYVAKLVRADDEGTIRRG
jgi:riboflavin synthase alpha subunit